jgi:hypothetical protein
VTPMSQWTRLSLLGAPFAFAALVVLACSGGAGSSLSSCPDPVDVAPGGVCTTGTACTSAAALPDCPGSAGSLTCNCTGTGWVCADPTASACFPDAGDDGGDGGDGGDETAEAANGDAGDQTDAFDVVTTGD